jgi:hypothetical protein
MVICLKNPPSPPIVNAMTKTRTRADMAAITINDNGKPCPVAITFFLDCDI